MSTSELRAAFLALVAVVREEFGDSHSLTEIAATWGGGNVSQDQLAALTSAERELVGAAA